MYSERARRYMAAMEAQYDPDYLHERYALEAPVDPADCDPDDGVSGAGVLPFRYWVESEADQWAARQRRADERPAGYDVESYRRDRLRRLRERQRVNFDEDRALDIYELSRALGEEEIA